jgi:hypothetical protein
MTKEKNDKHYNGQREKGQTLPLQCLSFFSLAIVMFVLFLFGYRNVCPFSLWSL